MTKHHLPNPNRPGYTKCGKSSFMRGLPTGGVCSVCYSSRILPESSTTSQAEPFRFTSPAYMAELAKNKADHEQSMAEIRQIAEDARRRMRENYERVMRDAGLTP